MSTVATIRSLIACCTALAVLLIVVAACAMTMQVTPGLGVASPPPAVDHERIRADCREAIEQAIAPLMARLDARAADE